MSVITPESLRQEIEAPVEGLSPRVKREVVSAAERAFTDIWEMRRKPFRGNGAYLLVSTKAGALLHVVFEGKALNVREAHGLFDQAKILLSDLVMNEGPVSEFTKGGVKGKSHIIIFSGFSPEEDEAAALYVALQINELTRDEVDSIAEKARNHKFKELMLDAAKKKD